MTKLREAIETAKATGVISIKLDGEILRCVDITDQRIDRLVKKPATKRALSTARRYFHERNKCAA